MTSEMIFLNDEERMSNTELEEIIGGKKKLTIKCNFEIVICYVEKTDTLQPQK